MNVTLQFKHQHVQRNCGTPFVEPEPLGEFELKVNMSHEQYQKLMMEMDRDFRLTPRTEESNIVFSGVYP